MAREACFVDWCADLVEAFVDEDGADGGKAIEKWLAVETEELGARDGDGEAVVGVGVAFVEVVFLGVAEVPGWVDVMVYVFDDLGGEFV